MTACGFCGRDNDAGAEFCSDCGKSLPGKPVGLKGVERSTARGSKGSAPRTQSAIATLQTAAAARCPFCDAPVSSPFPFCPACGRRLAPSDATTLVLTLLSETGEPTGRFERAGPHITVGRNDADLAFPDDPFLSPLHAKLSFEREGGDRRLVVRDLGSRNGTWVFLESPHRLEDGDLLLIGSQVIRFRRLGYPGPRSPDADATKRMGSVTPGADIATLTQLRADGSARDVIQLSPGRDVQIGRERGDWLFPYDLSMSAVHATVRSEDADFVVIDAHSRNGVALAARGAMPLSHQSRILVGDKLLRIELPLTIPAAAS